MNCDRRYCKWNCPDAQERYTPCGGPIELVVRNTRTGKVLRICNFHGRDALASEWERVY